MYRAHKEHHKSQKVGWLRAAVMEANDGVVSTAALILGGLAAYTGGVNIVKGTLRVTFWGSMAMIVTTGIGILF
ncbi:hypothetical protein ELY33_11170 [Vreelandella andesensis]|uniref:VIT family protein n=1 Tax=Vreelandella andesensis TaxID=447567 RepID=A0A433KLI7_9GAMM|nr:hypothetical protein [Halomonas andesensis]RUR30350.1 hypothetical protein ELY33_11170 [Halomonas andesensis]